MTTRVLATFVALALALVASPSAIAREQTEPRTRPSTIDLLDGYARGEFTRVTATLDEMTSFDGLLKDLKADGPAWIGAGGERDRPRRELAAATFALEAARAGEWADWKTIVTAEVGGGFYFITSFAAPADLVEWGCALLRSSATPSPQEHLWQLAAMSVSERAEDFEFMVGYTVKPGDVLTTKVVDHVQHVLERFPREPRFQLAYGIAQEWEFPDAARRTFAQLQDNLDAGDEATTRLGAIALRQGDADGALALLKRVDSLTRDPWLLYLARYFAGQAYEKKQDEANALRAYRAALAARPTAQAASVALASLLFRTGDRAEAGATVQRMLGARPVAVDPWRAYADADDRFWPELVGALHREIHP